MSMMPGFDVERLRAMLENQDPFASPNAEPYWLDPAFYGALVTAAAQRLELLPKSDGSYAPEVMERMAAALQLPKPKKLTLGALAVRTLNILNGLNMPEPRHKQSKEWGPDD